MRLGLYLLWGALVGSALLAGGWWLYERRTIPPAGRAVWREVASYALFDQEGQPAQVEALQGKVVLLTFAYTRCVSVCPRLHARMREVLLQVPPEAPLVALSLSLDPERDTPAQVEAFLSSYAVPGRRWLFWRPISQKWAFDLAETVFRITAARLDSTDILHTDALFLIDCEGRLRGTYTSYDEHLLSHTRKLLHLCGTD